MKFLSAEQVERLHAALIARWGGQEGHGPRGPDGVEAVVQAVKNSYYTTVHELAAAYAVYLVEGHVFADGNKRTGAATAIVFLTLNLAPCSLPPSDLEEAMFELQRRYRDDHARSGDLVAWLASLLAPLQRRGGKQGQALRVD